MLVRTYSASEANDNEILSLFVFGILLKVPD